MLSPPSAGRGGDAVPLETGRTAKDPPELRPAALQLREQTREAKWEQVWDKQPVLSVIAGGGGRLPGRACGGGPAYPGLGRDAHDEPAGPAPT